jgi:anti-anti-sigma factor
MDDLLRIEAVNRNGSAQLRLGGELDLASRSVVQSALARLVRESQVETIVVDVSGLTFCDASGLHALAAGQRAAAAHGKSLELAHPGPEVQLVLDAVQFGRVVPIRMSGEADSRR